MKITNKLGLPQALVNAVQRHEHKGGDYSASGLRKPARMHWLKKRHGGEVERDVSEMIWQLFGTAVHAIIEKGEQEDQLVEEYLSTEILGRKVSGIADMYDGGVIQDWKTTSVWSYIYLDAQKMDDYESQLNTYAYLYDQAGFPVDSLEVVLLFRDWQKRKAQFDASYPQQQAVKVPVNLWTVYEQEAYLTERIRYFEEYRDTHDLELPFCTEAERWAKPARWAVVKKERKKAVKLHETAEDARRHAERLGEGYSIEERKGELYKRCEYCDAREFCNQYGTREGQEAPF